MIYKTYKCIKNVTKYKFLQFLAQNKGMYFAFMHS